MRRGQLLFFQDGSHDGIICQLVSAVIFKVGGDDLADHLHQVVRIRMETADCMVVGFKQMLYKPGQVDSGREFFDGKQSSVRRKIAAVEVYFDLLIAFK